MGLHGSSGVVVFDLYGVIARTQAPAAKRRIAGLAGMAGPAETAFWATYWQLRPAYDAGLAGRGYWRSVGQRMGRSFTDAEIAALIEADVASWLDVDDRMVRLLPELAGRGWTLGLLSNTVEELVPRFEARHAEWLRYFRVLAYSCRLGVAKPDRRAYELCIERLGTPAGDVLFFDDNEVNVVAARQAGMRAEIFTSAEAVRKMLFM